MQPTMYATNATIKAGCDVQEEKRICSPVLKSSANRAVCHARSAPHPVVAVRPRANPASSNTLLTTPGRGTTGDAGKRLSGAGGSNFPLYAVRRCDPSQNP